jgi:opacity protein-like surface antigen
MIKSNCLACVIVSGILILLSLPLAAQDDLLNMLEEEKGEDTSYAFATFKGTRVINLQSPELPSKGVLQYIFIHRFGSFSDDYFYNFLGMNVAEVALQLDYGITDWLNFGLAYGSATPRTYNGFLKYKLLRQSSGGRVMPITLTGYSSIFYNAERYNDDLPRNNSDRLSFVNQAVIARKFNKNFSMEIVPTHVHFNLVNLKSESNDLFSLGLGGRYKLTSQLAVTAEYIYQFNPLETNLQSPGLEIIPQENQNVLSVGVDIETGGHVFQIFLTNSRGVSDPYTIAQTPGKWSEGDIHLGFNISRVFTIVRPKEFSDL